MTKILILLIIPFICFPSGLAEYWGISHFLIYARLLISFLLPIWAFIKGCRLDKFTAMIYLYVLISLIETFLLNGNSDKCIIYFCNIISPITWCQIVYRTNIEQIALKYLSYFICVIAAANIIAYYLFPNGLTTIQTGELIVRTGLISNDNSISPYLIPSCCVVMYYLNMRDNKSSILQLFLLIFLFTYTIYWVFTGIGVFLSFMLLFLSITFLKADKLSYIINSKRLFSFFIIIYMLFCIFQQQSSFVNLLAESFDSSSTFSGRTYLWQYAIGLIEKRPLFGYGFTDDIYLMDYDYRTTAHNMFLQFIIWGGIFGFFPLACVLFMTFSKAQKYWNSMKQIRIIFLGVFLLLIYYMFEVHSFVPIFWICVAILNYKVWDKEVSCDCAENVANDDNIPLP